MSVSRIILFSHLPRNPLFAQQGSFTPQRKQRCAIDPKMRIGTYSFRKFAMEL
jgi:hypothetical protein